MGFEGTYELDSRRMQRFLDETQDYNPLHREPQDRKDYEFDLPFAVSPGLYMLLSVKSSLDDRVKAGMKGLHCSYIRVMNTRPVPAGCVIRAVAAGESLDENIPIEVVFGESKAALINFTYKDHPVGVDDALFTQMVAKQDGDEYQVTMHSVDVSKEKVAAVSATFGDGNPNYAAFVIGSLGGVLTSHGRELIMSKIKDKRFPAIVMQRLYFAQPELDHIAAGDQITYRAVTRKKIKDRFFTDVLISKGLTPICTASIAGRFASLDDLTGQKKA